MQGLNLHLTKLIEAFTWALFIHAYANRVIYHTHLSQRVISYSLTQKEVIRYLSKHRNPCVSIDVWSKSSDTCQSIGIQIKDYT